MKKLIKYILIIVIIIAVGTPSAKAEFVSQREAKKIAETFFNAAYGYKLPTPEFVYNGRRLTTDRLFSPFYIYNCKEGGYVIISADNKAFPILSYDLSMKFDAENIGDDMKAILSMYARHIEYIRFDSNLPEKAIKAWQNLPMHIYSILTSPENNFEAYHNRQATIDAFTDIIETDDVSSVSSIYYPDQWTEMLHDEIIKSKNIAIGIINDEIITPIFIRGFKGDMFRLTIDNHNSGHFRLFATEIISDGQVAVFSSTTQTEEPIFEESPFNFYDTFIAQMRAEREAQQTAIENTGIITEPLVQRLGGGHYTITIAEQIERVRVYSLNGSTVYQAKYNGTNCAAINIAHRPNGFYFAVVFSTTGKTYNIKLFR